MTKNFADKSYPLCQQLVQMQSIKAGVKRDFKKRKEFSTVASIGLGLSCYH